MPAWGNQATTSIQVLAGTQLGVQLALHAEVLGIKLPACKTCGYTTKTSYKTQITPVCWVVI